jgi:hypothetical protein
MLLTLLRVLTGLAASVWLGGLVAMAIVAQTTFGVMPATGVASPAAVAGQVMARNFARFDVVQIICAGLLALLQAAALATGQRGARVWARALLVLSACGALAYQVLLVTPRITGLQAAVSSPTVEAEVRAVFDGFHDSAVQVYRALLAILLVLMVDVGIGGDRRTKPAGAASGAGR